MNKYDRGNEDFKPFSEYRHKDYVTPRSMKEIYGHEPLLFGEQEDGKGDKLVVWLAMCIGGLLIGFFVIPYIFGGK